MKPIFYFLTISFLFIYTSTNAQDLSKHQWKERVLLILTDAVDTPEFQNQIKVLKKNIIDLKVRKLIIYQITPNHYKAGISEEIKWNKKKDLYQELKTDNQSFEIILIGLDGGEKLRQSNILTTDKLFSIIDGMPMRRAEIKNKN
jgi:hypothetical protein